MGAGDASERFQKKARPSQEPDAAAVVGEGFVSTHEIVNKSLMKRQTRLTLPFLSRVFFRCARFLTTPRLSCFLRMFSFERVITKAQIFLLVFNGGL